ncbi:MAG: NAD(P)-binding protein, partial [Hyphococcus sp.]
MKTDRRRDVAIIGAGIGGLAAAAILSKNFNVAVYERAAKPGGKIRQIPVGDGAIDSGPTVFTMRWVFERIFAETGAAFDDYLS